MTHHGFSGIEDFRGASLPYFTTHQDLVRRQREALEAKRAARVGLAKDDEWQGDSFVKQSESMVAN
jgi:dihydropyrimidine dehydrogenase (NADP+)